jgi:hypothetical protein
MSKPVGPLAYMLQVMADPLCARERRDAMAKAAIARLARQARESEAPDALRRGMEETGSAAADKLERLLSGSP